MADTVLEIPERRNHLHVLHQVEDLLGIPLCLLCWVRLPTSLPVEAVLDLVCEPCRARAARHLLRSLPDGP